MQVIVLGMHRSGTSVVGGMLEQMGFYWGKLEEGLPADEDNPKGYWERKDVVALNDAILQTSDANWNRVSFFLNKEAVFKNSFQAQIQAIINKFEEHSLWFIKDPRLCLTLPLWLKATKKPLVIMTFRHPIQVAKSLEKRDGIPIQVGLALWQFYYLNALSQVRELPKLMISYDRLMKEPLEVWKQTHIFFMSYQAPLSKNLAAEKIFDLIDPSLFRQKDDPQLEEIFLTSSQRELWQRLNSGEAFELNDKMALSLKDKEVLGFYDRYAKLQEDFQQLTQDTQQTIHGLKKQLSYLLKKSDEWINILHHQADHLLNSKAYRLGNCFLLKRFQWCCRRKNHAIDNVLRKFQEIKKSFKF